MARYKVIGATATLGAQPGEFVEADLDPDQEQRLIARGAIEPVAPGYSDDDDIPAYEPEEGDED